MERNYKDFLTTAGGVLLKLLLNKYAMLLIAFVCVMFFNSSYTYFDRMEYSRRIKNLKDDLKEVTDRIERDEKMRSEIFSSNETLERFAREKYHMKKHNEDIFLIKED